VPHDPTAIRNVALVAIMAPARPRSPEALLAATGSIARRGSVEKGSTVMDFEPEEVARQLSISTSLAPFTVNGVKVNLLDTPGYADFAGEMVTAWPMSTWPSSSSVPPTACRPRPRTPGAPPPASACRE